MSPGALHSLPAASVGVSRMMVSSGGAPSDPGPAAAEVSATSVATTITELAEAGTTHAPSVEIVDTLTLEIK